MRSTTVRLAVIAAIAAQSAVMTQTAQAAESASLEEITVTATRVATDVQDIPLAISAFTAEGLEQHNITDLEDLTGNVPNILIAGDNGGTTGGSFYMRGIPNVGVYLDGIWQVSNNGLLTRDFVELERIEVLRGPQGTLYGRDSTGGSIHIHSKKPAKEFGVTASIGVGNLERRDLMVSADIPLGEHLSTKFTLADYHQDGWVHSLTTGINDGYMDSQVRRADILWTPTDKLSFRFIHQEDDQVGRQARVQARIDFNVAYLPRLPGGHRGGARYRQRRQVQPELRRGGLRRRPAGSLREPRLLHAAQRAVPATEHASCWTGTSPTTCM